MPAGYRSQILQRQLGQRERHRSHAARRTKRTASHEEIELDIIRVITWRQGLVLEHLFTKDFGRVRVQVLDTVVKRTSLGVTQDIGQVNNVRAICKAISGACLL